MERMIEVCAGSYQDCIAAYQGSAKRVELNSALSVGGLTPSVASLVRVKQETDLTVICMVRVRAAGFCYEKEDVEIMLEDAKILLEHGADGIAFGQAQSLTNIYICECRIFQVHGQIVSSQVRLYMELRVTL